MAILTSKSLNDVFISVVAEGIISFLAVTDLIALQGVCRSLREAVKSRLDHRFNINLFLKDFLQDPGIFRLQLGKADALIVRGPALNFLESQHRQFEYLDLLVEDGDKARSLIDYLCTEEFYFEWDFIPISSQPGGSADQSELTTILRRISGGELLESAIRVRRTSAFPIYALLANCCMTAELNFVTWNKAFSLFPAATLAKHKTYPLRPMDDEFGTLLRELSCQGWTTRDMLSLALGAQPPYKSGPRRVGDTRSVCVSLAPHINSAGCTPDYVIEHAAFDVSVKMEQSSKKGPLQIHWSEEMALHVRKLDSPSLYYQFTVGIFQSWPYFVDRRLEHWTRIEMFKIPRTSRSFSVTSRGVLPEIRGTQRPPDWDYADDQIPAWYEVYRQTSLR